MSWQSIVVFQGHLTHTQLITEAGDAPTLHTHTLTLREVWPFQAMFSHRCEDKLIMGLFMHAVSFRHHPVGTEAPAECWQMLRFCSDCLLRRQPQAAVACSRRTHSCLEHQQVLICALVTKWKAWECRWKRKSQRQERVGR